VGCEARKLPAEGVVFFLDFYLYRTYQIRPRLTLDLGAREDFQVYPQPRENPAFPITGQFPNQYQRVAPRFGFAWLPLDKTVVRGGFGLFYENFNGLNYRNSMISNGNVFAAGIGHLCLQCQRLADT
jgi:hypothetical protein